MRPDYDPPRPHLVRPLRWHWADHETHVRIVRLWSPSNQAWSQQLAWTGAVHEALEEGEDFDGIVAAAGHELTRDARELRRKVGTYLYMLMVEGFVGMDFPPPPERFAPHLETRKELGRGGVGVAWLCRDTRNDRDVVVKHAWDYFQPLEYTDGLMRQEAAIFRSLDHPGILRLHETIERDGILYMVRDFVDGTPLMLARPQRPEAQQEIARDLLDIVAHLHARGHLILDLRPANFFCRATDGRLVLVDVGSCVAHVDGFAKVKKGIGTPGFTAPEVRKKGHATVASVVYGYGRLLFQLAAGRRPLKEWQADDLVAQLGPHPLSEAIRRATASDPAERPDLEGIRALLA